MKLRLVFSGGSEVLFNDKKEHSVEVSEDLDVRSLLAWILKELIAVNLSSLTEDE